MQALSTRQKRQFLTLHIPHRLCLLSTFRLRQPWFKTRIGKEDGDLLRIAKDSALITIRLFSEFLGLMPEDPLTHDSCTPRRGQKNDDVSVEMLGGRRLFLHDLKKAEANLIRGLYQRASKELAHMTRTYTGHARFNTARAIVDGSKLIENLLREHLYDVVGAAFPTLTNERIIHFNHWQFVDGPRMDRGRTNW